MDKLEKHIKEKLEERTFAPSKGAWDKIAPQVKEPVPRKRNAWFPYAIAASVVGIVLVSVFFFKSQNAAINEPQVVESETQEASDVKAVKNEEKELVPEMETEVAEAEVEFIEPKDASQFQKANSNTAVAEQQVNEPLQDEIQINSDKLIAQKVEEVVAQVQVMEDAKQDVTDAEVDSLLRAAQRQILTDKLFADGGSVDAMSLLAEVEDELDESFRDQIFDALKSGYLKLRTAVADRNQ